MMDNYILVTNFILFLFEIVLLFITSFANFYYETLTTKIYCINNLNIILFFTELLLPLFKFDILIIVILILRSINILLLSYVFYKHINQDTLMEDEEEDEEEINNRQGVYHALCIL